MAHAGMTQFSTKERIIGAAEELFAQHGFAGASLRQLTAAANVNLAAVNYHFGSKENLLTEVFRRRLDELNGRRLEELARVEAEDPIQLEAVLAAFINPALAVSLDRRHGGGTFVRVLARAYAEQNQQLRAFLSQHYRHVTKRFVDALCRALPGLPRREVYWRLDFVAGALTYVMGEFGTITRPSEVEEAAFREAAAQRLIRFAAGGLRA